jgi:hypothetical protein
VTVVVFDEAGFRLAFLSSDQGPPVKTAFPANDPMVVEVRVENEPESAGSTSF